MSKNVFYITKSKLLSKSNALAEILLFIICFFNVSPLLIEAFANIPLGFYYFGGTYEVIVEAGPIRETALTV